MGKAIVGLVVALFVLLASECLKAQDTASTPSSTDWIGKVAPGFTLPGIDGKEVDVGKVFGKQPVVLVFYRAFW